MRRWRGAGLDAFGHPSTGQAKSPGRTRPPAVQVPVIASGAAVSSSAAVTHDETAVGVGLALDPLKGSTLAVAHTSTVGSRALNSDRYAVDEHLILVLDIARGARYSSELRSSNPQLASSACPPWNRFTRG